MVFSLQAAKCVLGALSATTLASSRTFLLASKKNRSETIHALRNLIVFHGKVMLPGFSVGSHEVFSSFSTTSNGSSEDKSKATSESSSSKQIFKTRTVTRKGKAEIFTKDLGKKPKIHLKPSLLSADRKSPVSSKEHPISRVDRRGIQKRQKANLAVNEIDPVQDNTASELCSKTPIGERVAFQEAEEDIDVDADYRAENGAAYDLEDWEQQNLDENDYQQTNVMEHIRAEALDVYVSVEAFFLARSVDLKGLAQEASVNVVPCRNHVVIKFNGSCSRKDNHPMPDCLSNERLVVVFQYGSVVLFNFDEASIEDECLKVVKKHCKEVFSEPKKDNYRVLVRPSLDRWSQGGPDKIMVKKLDMDGIRIISLVLSQSIALDHYTRGIDEMLNTFGELNRGMELTGTFNMKRKDLFKVVAAANTALADAILRLGLLERSDVAWQNAKYDRIWEYMRDDFELDDRFESLEFKTGIIQHNVKFFLDILQNRKSDTLEWIIILLIAGEICVSVYDILHGTGAL